MAYEVLSDLITSRPPPPAPPQVGLVPDPLYALDPPYLALLFLFP